MKQKYKAIRDLEGHDPWSLFFFVFMSLSHWIIAVLVSWGLTSSYVCTGLIGWQLGGFWANAAGNAVHEASHRLVLPGRWGSFFAGLIAEMPLFFPGYQPFLHYHKSHHAYFSLESTSKER
jgi:fatty acid desaturase